MKKLLLAVSAMVLSLGLAQNAMADCNGIYLGMRGGVVKHKYSKKGEAGFNTDNLDKSKLMLSGALGYRYDYVWRDKNDYKYSAGGGGSSKLAFRTYSYMLNGYIDLAPYSWFSPYISAGIGFTKMKYSEIANGESWTTNGNYNPTRLTWSLGGGATVKVTNRFNVDAGYRYYDMGAIRHMDVDAHEIYGGVRYVF